MGLDLVHVLSPKRHYCEFVCGRCKRLTSLDSYVASNCAHPICKSCCNKKMPKTCPRCTKPVGELKCLKASQPLAHRVLTRIKVACPMRHRSGSHQGCKWVGSYDEIQAHLDSNKNHNRSQPRRQSSSKKNKHELEDSVVITTAAAAEAAVVVEDTPPTPTPITADSSSPPVIIMKKESSKELITTLKKEGSRETVKTIPRSNCTSTKMESCCNNNGSSDTMDVVVETTEVEDNNTNNILATTTTEKTNNEILVVTVDSLESIDTDEMDLHKAYNNREVSNHKKKEVEVEPAPPIIEIPTPIIENKKTVETFDSQIIQDDNGGEPDTVEELKEQQQGQQYPTTCSYEDSCADFGKAFEECIVPMEIVVANDNPDSWAIKDAAIIPPEEPPPPPTTSKSPLRRRSSSSNRRRQRRRASSSSILSQEQQQQLSESDNDVEMNEHHRCDNNNNSSRHRPPITRKKDLQRSVMETSDSEDKNDGGGSSSSRSLQSRSRRNSYQEHSESETSHENDDHNHHREQHHQQQQQHQTPRSSSKRKRRRSKRVIEISEPVEDTDDMVVADNNNNMFMSSNNNNNDITNDLDVASTWKEEGIRAFNAGNYKEAGEFLTCAINSLPNSNREPKLVSMLLSNRAESFLKMDLFTRCLEDAEEALDLDNQNVKAYLVKSTAQTELSCFGEACKTLARGCLNTDSQEISEQLKTTRELSRCIREIRSLENENRHSDILRVIQTSDSSLLLNGRPHKLISQARAAALVDLGQYDEAITETNELLEKNDKKGNNNNAVAFFIRARAKFFNGLVSESLSDCQSAMTTNDYNTDNMRELDDFGDLVNCVEHSFRFAEEAMKNKDYEQGCNFYGLAFDSIQSKLELPKNSELYRILHMGSAEANYKAGNTEQALMHSNLVVESSQHNNNNNNGNGNGNGNGENNNNNDNNKYSSSSMEDQKPSSIVVQPSYSQELVCSTGNHPSKY